MKRDPRDVIEVYERTGSLKAAGAELGISHSRVSQILLSAGYHARKDVLTPHEKSRIVEYYERAAELGELRVDVLVKEFGRSSRVSIERYARKQGLTRKGWKIPEETRKATGRKLALRISLNGHPRGALGMVHTPEARAKMGAASRKKWATWKAFGIGLASPEHVERRRRQMAERQANAPASANYTRGRGGRRSDIGETFFRSSWEANYARYLNLLIKLGVVSSWEYEPVTFWFTWVKRGVVSYKPDFRVFYKNDAIPEFIEIKGFKTAKDETKWRRMKKYHPDIKLVVVGVKEYRALRRKWSSSIPNWETDIGGGGRKSPFINLGTTA